MIGYVWVAHGSQEDRIELPEKFQTVGRHHRSFSPVSVARPVKRLVGKLGTGRIASGVKDGARGG
jgi:hypothetical protein